MNKKKGSVMK